MGKPDAGVVLERLEARYGRKLHTELKHSSKTDLFVAVFLSPQCTDKQVNNVTDELFKRFRSFKDYAECNTLTLMKMLSGINYYRTKSKNLKKSAKIIIERFGGRIPRTIGELTELPGVGRKVANVVLNECFGINEGIAVDTHCATVARRLQLSRHKDPGKIELDLMGEIPREKWGETSNIFIALGRDTCKARNRECGRCVLRDICPSSNA